MRTSVGTEINKALATLNSPMPFEITTGSDMAPFLVFSVHAFDANQSTIDIQFKSLGFSTILRTVDPQNHQVLFGTALSLVASGQGHLSKAGSHFTLSYKFNLGTGLLPIGQKFASQINNALIPKLEAFADKFLASQIDTMIFFLQLLPNH